MFHLHTYAEHDGGVAYDASEPQTRGWGQPMNSGRCWLDGKVFITFGFASTPATTQGDAGKDILTTSSKLQNAKSH